MRKKSLENSVEGPCGGNTSVSQKTYNTVKSGFGAVRRGYEKLHSAYPEITNYLSSAVGVVGGDALAKQFTDDPSVSVRDVVFTAAAAGVYSYLALKMIEWSTKVTNKIGKSLGRLKGGSMTHTLANTSLLTAMYFPVNMAYWNYLTIKNEAPITLEDNIAGAITLGVGTIPYLVADYVAIKKLSQPKTKKFLRPFYSAVGIGWNTLFAGGNYLAKRI